MKIVVPNHLDRESSDRWFVRDGGSLLESGVPCRSLLATGVEFTVSSNAEQEGFGCFIVAHCATVEIFTDPLAGIPTPEEMLLYFSKKAIMFYLAGRVEIGDSGFYRGYDDTTSVEHCKTLRLMPDGSMYATF